MKKHFIFLVFLVLILPNFIFGAFLRNIPVKKVQPDGAVIQCFASGDEFYNWLHDENNYTIVKNPETGYYVYAIIQNEKITPSDYIVGRTDPESMNLEPGVNIFPDRSLLKSAQHEDILRAPSKGNYNNIVIFIRFADQTEFNEPVSEYDEFFNGNDNSLNDYFKEISGNQLNITSTFYPAPANNLVVSWQDQYVRDYYVIYDETTNPIGYKEGEDTEREHTLLANAINAVKPAIEASGLEFDSDNDGYIDNICFIVQGNVEGWNDLLWPHKWALYSQNVYINGKRVWEYNFQLSDVTDVSVLCHEMFHTLGAPDLYHYSHDGLVPVGGWDLMAMGQCPAYHYLDEI
jgi:M6 family metalloprotease-like protein